MGARRNPPPTTAEDTSPDHKTRRSVAGRGEGREGRTGAVGRGWLCHLPEDCGVPAPPRPIGGALAWGGGAGRGAVTSLWLGRTAPLRQEKGLPGRGAEAGVGLGSRVRERGAAKRKMRALPRACPA